MSPRNPDKRLGTCHNGDEVGIRQDLVDQQASRDQRQQMVGQVKLSEKGWVLLCAHPSRQRQHGRYGRSAPRMLRPAWNENEGKLERGAALTDTGGGGCVEAGFG